MSDRQEEGTAAADNLCQAGTMGQAQVIESSKYPGLAGENADLLAEAEKRYAKALEGATQLNLRGLRLVSLPDSLGICTSLESLACVNNVLTMLPKSIGNCISLHYLECDHNKLMSLPESIGECKSLDYLICANNDLTVLPESIGNCTALKNLDCGKNRLTVLPETIGNCIALEYLQCGGNQLTEIPTSLGKCAKLNSFYCDNNPWDPDWLKAQGADKKPTIATLRELATKQSAGRVKPARA